MVSCKRIVFIAVLAFTSAVFGVEKAGENMKGLVAGYIDIQEALASDNLGQAKAKASDLLRSKAELNQKQFTGLKSELTGLSEAPSLQKARDRFKKISPAFVEWLKANKDDSLEILYCPMAGAKWVQKKGDVKNPYYGSEMLRCGERSS